MPARNGADSAVRSKSLLFNERPFAVDLRRILTRGDAAENFDWLSDDSEAPAVLERADRSCRDLDPFLVVPTYAAVECLDELLDCRRLQVL
jgi:hypothetical protein